MPSCLSLSPKMPISSAPLSVPASVARPPFRWLVSAVELGWRSASACSVLEVGWRSASACSELEVGWRSASACSVLEAGGLVSAVCAGWRSAGACAALSRNSAAPLLQRERREREGAGRTRPTAPPLAHLHKSVISLARRRLGGANGRLRLGAGERRSWRAGRRAGLVCTRRPLQLCLHRL